MNKDLIDLSAAELRQLDEDRDLQAAHPAIPAGPRWSNPATLVTDWTDQIGYRSDRSPGRRSGNMVIEEMAMAWMETDPVSERVRFISAWLSREESVSALAIRFGVSRKTAYKWIGRYAAEGPSGLAARSSAPVTQAAQTPPKIVTAILRLRRKHPAWGPRKLRARLQLDDPKTKWPADSTIGDILKREGLVRPRKLRRRVPPAQHPFRGADAPNDVWCIDFKGFWKTGDGVRVLPFTVTDAMSRYLLVCQAVEHPDFETVWPILVRAFKEYGLPRAIRSDNGPPFGAVAAGGLSRLAVNFVRMGITPERITPGKPQENGRHERMHQTLKREAATPPSLTAKAQLARLERFRQIFNEERPHEALAGLLGCYARSHGADQRIDPLAWAGAVRLRGAQRRTHRHLRNRRRRIRGSLRPNPAGLHQGQTEAHPSAPGQTAPPLSRKLSPS
jgi:transposase InsO family protein